MKPTVRVGTTDVAIGGGSSLKMQQRTFHGSARGATDATGTTLWPTALPLLLHLQGVLPRVQSGLGANRPLRVLELGAGCGLLGLGLASTCGADVLLTESGVALGDDDEAGTSLTWLDGNVELNRAVCEAQGGRVSTAKLAWGVDGDIAAIRERHPEGFDLVVASDVMYDSTRYPELWETLECFAGSSAAASARQLPAIAAAAAGWADEPSAEEIDEECVSHGSQPGDRCAAVCCSAAWLLYAASC